MNNDSELDLIERILDRNRINKHKLYLFKTLREDLGKEGFIFNGLEEESGGYVFQNVNGLNLIIYPSLFYPNPDYFHLYNWSLSY